MTSDNFCSAAWNGFTLILKNAGRFGTTHTIGFVYMFFGCLCIAGINAVCAYLFLTNYPALGITSPIAPIIVIVIISMVIAY